MRLALLAVLSSFCFDFCLRQKVGGPNINFFIVEQAAVPRPATLSELAPWNLSESIARWLDLRALELTYTSVDLVGLGRDIGWNGAPFRWDGARRDLLRAELDAAVFHLYGFERQDVDYIMETFPIVRQNDERAHGEYRSKRLILGIYDALAKAIETGMPYMTMLDPPPADPRVAYPAS